MNVHYVITDLETGGVPLHLYQLARHMRDRGLGVHVTCLAPTGPVSRMLADAGIGTTACDARGPWDWSAVERLGGVLADSRPDVVHSFLFHANVACRLLVLLGGLSADRLVCEIQTVEVERRWHLIVERFTHRWCRRVVGNSPSVVEHLARHARIDADRLVLVQGGIDPAPFQQAAPADRASLGLNETDPVLVWTGRLDPVKRLDDLVAAAAIVNRSIPVQVLLVGEGPDRARVEGVVEKSGMGGRVFMPGRRTDIANLLKLADVFVFPSLTEGMPNALLEAMAAGLPIVATDVPGNRDLIRHGETGLLARAGDREQIAGHVSKLLIDKRLRDRLRIGAASATITRFHIGSTWRAYLDLYALVAAGQQGS